MSKTLFLWLAQNLPTSACWSITGWTVIGLLVGAGLGLGIFLALRARGGYKLERPHAKWWRGSVCALHLVVFSLGCGYVGFWEGAWRTVRNFAETNSVVALASEEFGKREALLFGGLHYACALALRAPHTSQEEAIQTIRTGVERFAAGQEKMEVKVFREEMDTVGKVAVNRALGVVNVYAQSAMPELAKGAAGPMLQKLLVDLGGSMAQKQTTKELKRFRVEAYLDPILAGMSAEAARAATPGSLSYAELSSFLAREGLMPWLLRAARRMVRFHQNLAALVMVMAAVLPILGFWAVRRRDRKRTLAAMGMGHQGAQNTDLPPTEAP
ncbi:hypothetical protein [Holophaga foetida]|uniref:hypothetical protein n=1 Tax=Holophaga foetida TaxID=35839 RepID=UPI0002472A73|nr:hypothetical protein [Holophaga foetida]